MGLCTLLCGYSKIAVGFFSSHIVERAEMRREWEREELRGGGGGGGGGGGMAGTL